MKDLERSAPDKFFKSREQADRVCRILKRAQEARISDE
jgi:hypothetical protein